MVDFATVRNYSKEVPALAGDNASVVKLTRNPEVQRRTKHIDVRYHVREKCCDNTIGVEQIRGEKQVANIITKPLARIRFEKLIRMLGILEA